MPGHSTLCELAKISQYKHIGVVTVNSKANEAVVM
jgi:hypothetical protein